MSIGRRIKVFVAERGISLRTAAEMCDISYNTLYDIIKRDNFEIKPKTLEKLCNGFCVDANYFLGENTMKTTFEYCDEKQGMCCKSDCSTCSYHRVRTLNDYQCAAQRTSNGALTEKEQLINGVLGMCGEAGEVADLVKKHLAQGHELDIAHVVKELGDVMWYIAETADALGVWLEDICNENIQKLIKRYPSGFDSDRSINRAADDI